jgi:fatty-acid peroxygenase
MNASIAIEHGHAIGLPPRARHWDSSFALLADPYRFIGKTCAALGSDVFETRLMLRQTVCMTGVQAAAVFYDDERLQRAGAAPEPLRATLFGKGAVQSLDGAAHLQRKALLVSVTAAQQGQALVQRTRELWLQALPGWSRRGPQPLYRMLQPLLTRAVCDWAGVPVPEQELPLRTRQLVALFDSAASGPWQHIRSRWARWHAELWLASLVRAERRGEEVFTPGSAAHQVAWHHDLDGALLPPRIAAVELLNLLRPVVAVSLYMTFTVHALRVHAGHWERLHAAGAEGKAAAPLLAFAQEVRRHYPFFPALVAQVRHDFEWRGLAFHAGRRVMLDIYGTNHDPSVWDDPWTFEPERFDGRIVSEFAMIPQGGADLLTRHRCPGEDITVRLMMLALQMSLHHMRYRVPQQSLEIRMNRLPAVPADEMVIEVMR